MQSGTINLWGVQLEVGSNVTPLEKLGYALDYLHCQRFYQTGIVQELFISAGTGVCTLIIPFQTSMRATPTMTSSYTTQVNGTGSVAATAAYGFQNNVNVTGGATSSVNVAGTWTASADL